MRKNKFLVLSIFLLFIFFIWSFFLVNGTFNEIDNFITNTIVSFRNSFSNNFFRLITNAGSVIFVVIVICVLLYFIKEAKLRKWAIILVGGEILLNNAIKLIFHRARPLVEHLVIEKSYSYPSGHAMVSSFFYGMALFLIYHSSLSNKNKVIVSTTICILVTLICFSRIYLGVHYFSDVIGGVLLGSAYFCFGVFTYYQVFSKKGIMN